METAKRTGLALIACAAVGLMVSMLAPQAENDGLAARPYAIAISRTSQLRLIELGGGSPAKTEAGGERLLFCRHVTRLAGLEFGTSCAREAATMADASL